MSATYMGRAIIARHRTRTRPALVLPDDTADLGIYRPGRAGEPSTDPLPRATWLHGILAGTTAAIAIWFTVDLADAMGDPDVISGHLRGALVGSAVILTVTLSNWRLHRRNDRLHYKTRAAVEWLEQRARIIDQRDMAIHQHLGTIADKVAAIGRTAADDLAATRRAVVEQRQDLVDIARGLGYASGRIRTLSQEVISVGGGQATMMEVLEHLARTVGQLSERQQRAAGDDPGDGQLGSDEVRRAYHLGEREARDSNIVAMPNAKAFELGRQIERRRWEQSDDNGGSS